MNRSIAALIGFGFVAAALSPAHAQLHWGQPWNDRDAQICGDNNADLDIRLRSCTELLEGPGSRVLLDHDRALGLSNRAIIHLKQKHPSKGLIDINEAVALVHKYPRSFSDWETAFVIMNRGVIEAAQDNLGPAVADFRDAIARYPRMVQVYYGLGICLSAQGDKSAAITMLRKGRDIASAHPWDVAAGDEGDNRKWGELIEKELKELGAN